MWPPHAAPAARLLYGTPARLDYASSPDAAFSWTESAGDLAVQVRDGDREHVLYSSRTGGGMDSDGRWSSHVTDGLLLDRGRTWPVDHRCAGEATRNGRVQDYMPEGEDDDS